MTHEDFITRSNAINERIREHLRGREDGSPRLTMADTWAYEEQQAMRRLWLRHDRECPCRADVPAAE